MYERMNIEGLKAKKKNDRDVVLADQKSRRCRRFCRDGAHLTAYLSGARQAGSGISSPAMLRWCWKACPQATADDL